jgi:hypothetical protein
MNYVPPELTAPAVLEGGYAAPDLLDPVVLGAQGPAGPMELDPVVLKGEYLPPPLTEPVVIGVDVSRLTATLPAPAPAPLALHALGG